MQTKQISFNQTRNLPTEYVTTAGGVQETELNAQTKHCSACRSRSVMVDCSWKGASWQMSL